VAWKSYTVVLINGLRTGQKHAEGCRGRLIQRAERGESPERKSKLLVKGRENHADCAIGSVKEILAVFTVGFHHLWILPRRHCSENVVLAEGVHLYGIFFAVLCGECARSFISGSTMSVL
jgi:hypothetical protein